MAHTKRSPHAPAAPTTAPRVLDFMRLIWALDHGLQVTSKRMAREIGLTGPQRLVIKMLAEHPDISAGPLADMLHVHKSTLTGVLQRLLSRGLIERRADTQDARRICLALTREGLRRAGPTPGTVEGAVQRIVDRHPKGAVSAARDVLNDLAMELVAPERGRASARTTGTRTRRVEERGRPRRSRGRAA